MREQNNQHINFFLNLKESDRILKHLHRKLKPEYYGFLAKEITEAVSTFLTLKSLLTKYKLKATLVDFCSGNLLLPMIYNAVLKQKAIAIDANPPDTDYIKGGKLIGFDVEFKQVDIFNEEVERILSTQSDTLVATGIHPCTTLAERIVELAEYFQILIIMPCCIGSQRYEEWKRRNKLLSAFFKRILNDEYALWTYYLAEKLAEKMIVRFKKDKFVLSERNNMVIGVAVREK